VVANYLARREKLYQTEGGVSLHIHSGVRIMPYKSVSCMIVEDDNAFRATAELMLRNIGFKYILTFADAESAWQQLNTLHFDVVLSDWNMEPLCGVELLYLIRAAPGMSSLKFVLMSANNDGGQAAVDAGAAAFLQKPFKLTELREILHELLAETRYRAPNILEASGSMPSQASLP
jgi:two-component system, chemotaxis family, chemotaxis protein CheY